MLKQCERCGRESRRLAMVALTPFDAQGIAPVREICAPCFVLYEECDDITTWWYDGLAVKAGLAS